MVVIEDYYHMPTMDKNVTWMKLTHISSIFSLNIRAAFCTSTYTIDFLIAILDVHTQENNTSSLCILCTLMPRITSLLKPTLVYTFYEQSTSMSNQHFHLQYSQIL